MKTSYLLKEARYYKKLGKGHLQRMFLKFLLTKTLASKIVNNKAYNKFYQSRINKQLGILKPSIFQIETTSFCNAKCIMCPHIYMKRKKKNMSQEEFIKICKNILPHHDIKLITLSGFGEPFIDPGLLDKIKWLNKNYPKIDLDIYTNASLLTPKITDEFLKLRFHKINFSINGTEKTYYGIMKLNYDKTKKNILYFLKKRNEMKKEFPLINISLMVLKENQDEIDKIVNFWKDKADSVMAYLPSDWAGKLKISGIGRNPFKKKRWPCKVLWTNITVDAEGNLVMCCRDYESKVKFGNLLKDNIKNIRNSKEFKELLEKQRAMDFSSPLCNVCNNAFDSSLDWWN